MNFNPQGSHEPRQYLFSQNAQSLTISIHKALTSLDVSYFVTYNRKLISIHKALTSLDRTSPPSYFPAGNFNPQGSHEPRPQNQPTHNALSDFNPQGSHEPRLSTDKKERLVSDISIHKALTSLDSKNTQLSLHPCQIYIS